MVYSDNCAPTTKTASVFYIYLNCHLAWKLDGYKVRLGTIRAKEKKERKKGPLGVRLGMCVCVCGMGTDCQKVSGSWSCRHSGPKPNLNEDTDHLARWPMSGHGSTGGLLTVPKVKKKVCVPTTLLVCSLNGTHDCEQERRLRGWREGYRRAENRTVRLSSSHAAPLRYSSRDGIRGREGRERTTSCCVTRSELRSA